MTEWLRTERIALECPAEGCPDPSRVKMDGTQNGKQRYECNSCGKRFHADGQALHKQYSAKVIGAAIDKYLSGVSYKQVAEHMEDFADVPEPSKRTIHDWVKSYGGMAMDFMTGRVGPDGRPETATGKPIRASTGGTWVADETYIRAGGDWRYCWNIMDEDSRLLIAVHFSAHRDADEAIKVLEKALASTDKPPKKIITDQYGSYDGAIKALLPEVEHVKSQGLTKEINNNLCERIQGTIQDRTKTQRGSQNIRTGQEYLDAWALDYNHFKKHESLDGRTPAEAAGVAGQVPWGDSWEDIARMGGEVAELVVKESTIAPNKSGPKPPPGSISEAAARFIEQKKYDEATAKRKSRNSAPVTSRPQKAMPRKRGRGRMRL